MNKKNLPDDQTNFLLYTGNDGKVNVEVFVQDETIWLTQKAMAELFGVKIPAISKHMLNICESGELQKEATLSILETVRKEGNRPVKRKMEFYNLDVILSVGYRVNSYQATQFRIWATRTLKEMAIPIPPESIIKSFDDKVNCIMSKILFNLQGSATISSLRDTRLPKLMSGEIRVKEFA